jgi:DNA-binding CsgD family transcriptional regulator
MPRSKLTELSNTIADIYDAAIDPRLWQKALASICAFVGGSSAVLFWHDSATVSSQTLHAFNDDPHYARLYFEKYFPMNPMFPAATFVEEGLVHTSRDILPQEELEKTRFYKEWIEPQGIVDAISVNLEKGVMRSSMINIRMNAADGVADNESKRRLALLVPHLQRAVSIGRLFDQNLTVQSALTQILDHIEASVFLVERNGRIVFLNAPARVLLDEATLLCEVDQSLTAVMPEANRMLREIFVAAENGDISVGIHGVAVPLSASPQDRWFAHVLPLTSGKRQRTADMYSAIAAVFVRKNLLEQPTPLEAFTKLHNLSASEARVVDAVMKGGSVKDMAERLGLSQATVKTHLQKIFQKTNVNRQSDLVKMIAGLTS